MSLTTKQQRFIEEYLACSNARQAAIRAGYSVRSAKEIGYENLTKPYIKAVIDAELADRSRKAEVEAYQVITALAEIAFANIGDFLDLDGSGPILHIDQHAERQLAPIATMYTVDAQAEGKPRRTRTVIRLHDKLRALDGLAKHLGMYAKPREASVQKGDIVKAIEKGRARARQKHFKDDTPIAAEELCGKVPHD